MHTDKPKVIKEGRKERRERKRKKSKHISVLYKCIYMLTGSILNGVFSIIDEW